MTITPISLYTPQAGRQISSTTAKVIEFIRQNWVLLTLSAAIIGFTAYAMLSSYFANRVIIQPPCSQTFDDLHSNIKQGELQPTIDFLKGGTLAAPQSFLLTGSGFSGKSHVARAVSQAAGVPIIEIDCRQNTDYLRNKVNSAFEIAKSEKGCVILIKHAEVLNPEDLIMIEGKRIQQPNPTAEQLKKDLNDLGKQAKVAVFVTAKTSTADLQHIHFDKKLSVSLPDCANRLSILTALTKDKECEADLKKWARKTAGWSYARLFVFVNQAQGKITDDVLDKSFPEMQKTIDTEFACSLKDLNDLGPGEFLITSDNTFDAIAGNKDAKDKMLEIADYLEDPEKYEKILKTPSSELAPKGVILHGEPGTGKTAMAGALANKANCAFLYVKGSLATKYVGDAAKNVRNLFAQARATNRPCIIFMDEIDAMGKRTDDMTGSAASAREMITTFASETDGLSDWPHPIIVIGATNRPDTLDSALTRPGRFDRMIEVKLPTKKEALEILKIHADKYHLDDNFNLDSIASISYGKPGAWLKEVLKEAARQAVKDGKDKISDTHLVEAYQKQSMGAATSEKQAKQELERTAAHEIGHALVAAKHGKTVQIVTIRPRGHAAGLTYATRDHDITPSKEELEQEVQILLGGQAAEEVMYKKNWTGCIDDRQRAEKIIHDMVYKYGYGNRKSPYPDKPSERLKQAAEQETEQIFDAQLAAAKGIITKGLIEKVRPKLMEEEILTADQFKKLLPEGFVQSASTSRTRSQTQ